MLWATPDNAENAMNTTIAARIRSLRPKRSDALPHRGVEAAAPRTYTVTTHESALSPPSWPAIVGSAVAMIVWSSAPMNIATNSPANPSSSSYWELRLAWAVISFSLS